VIVVLGLASVSGVTVPRSKTPANVSGPGGVALDRDRLGEDGRVHQDDVRHREERRQPGERLGPYVAVPRLDGEVLAERVTDAHDARVSIATGGCLSIFVRTRPRYTQAWMLNRHG
jgi:hypothetical protein